MGTGLISTSRGKPAAPPYTQGPYTWDQNLTLSGTNVHSGTNSFTGTVTMTTLTVTGTFTFGDAVTDSLIVNGRVTTGSSSGSALDIDATVTEGKMMEMRYTISSWAGIGNDFNGMYMRAQSDTDNASGVIHGIQTFAVANASGVSSLQGGFCQAYIKGDSTDTIGTAYGIHGEVSFDASRANTLTITTEMCAILGKILSGKVDDYTKIDGQILRFGDMDGGSRTYGNGILIEDDSSTSGTSTLTNGILITLACTSAQIKVEGTAILAAGEQAIYVNCAAETVATNGIWVTLKSDVVTGDVTGARIKATGLRLSSGGANIRGVYSQAIADQSSSFTVLIQGGLFVASYEGGSVTATDVYGVTGFISQGASLTASGNVAAVQAHLQTRGDESVSGEYAGILITNEGVGGNGSTLGSAIRITESTMGGGTKSYDVLIDATGVNTTVHDSDQTDLIKFRDSGGTERVLIYDPSNSTVVAVTTA